MAIGNRLAMRRRGLSTLRCLLCVHGSWQVHIWEEDRLSKVIWHAKQRENRRQAKIEEAVAEAMTPPPRYRPKPLRFRRRPTALMA